MSKKPRGEAVLKNLPDALQEQLWQICRRTTFEKARAWLIENHDLTVSRSTLCVWFAWYPRNLTLRSAATTSDQLAATLTKLPELKITAENAAKIAQVNFEIQAAQDRDPKLFSALRKGELEAARLKLERERFEHEKRQDWEKGLDALFEEIKAVPAAVKIFEQLKATLAAAKEKA